jgi:hypothetical protein
MVFAGPDGTIRHIHENAVPMDTTSIRPPEGVDDIHSCSRSTAAFRGGWGSRSAMSSSTRDRRGRGAALRLTALCKRHARAYDGARSGA